MKTLITCHANADCDAFASMLAARHIYKDADLLFPGTQEHSLSQIYNGLDKKKYGFVEQTDIQWETYDNLVLTDTRQKGRIPHAARLLEKEGISLEAWDHHPPATDDLERATLHYAQCGAVTSILCNELQKLNIAITAEEATLLGLGIYADTGSFSYSSTTQEDFQAAAWLLGHGMDVTQLNDMAGHEMTSLHVQALNALLESAHTYIFNGVPVVLAEASMTDYLGDFASLAHKLMEMEKFSVLFALGIMGDRVQVVARSRNSEINVGEICALLGGGGHEYAASASVKYNTVNEVREAILRSLRERSLPEKTARDYMCSPAIGIASTGSIHDADEMMLHFGLKAVPVFAPETRKCVGLLAAQIAARANSHGLGAEAVAEYMQRRVATLPPEASIAELSEIIVEGRQRLVPIVKNEEVIGVVTRTDLINVFANDRSSFATIKKNKIQNVNRMLTERLDTETVKILKLAGELGTKLKLPVYAVGGFTRDLLIGHPNKDIDLVAEGNGITLARELAQELGGRVREHQEFLTSVVIYHDDKGNERHIDVATARLEYYEYPAALPTVELSSIKMDLLRRDFSINALAVRLDGEFYGELVDFFGGKRDIKDKLIRVLHTLSFVEDPTRCVRAVRFEQRYNFRIGPGTEKLIKNILPMGLLEKLSPHRIFHEYNLLCQEENAAASFNRLDDLGILKAIGPYLELNQAHKKLLKRVQGILAWHKLLFFDENAEHWICYFLGISFNRSYTEAVENYRNLGLPENRKTEIMRQRETLKNIKPKLLEWQDKDDQGNPDVSIFCDLLRGLSLEFLLFLMAAIDNSGLERNISRFITQWRNVKPDITGYDLKQLGIAPGPVYAELLKKALDAKLNGKAPTAGMQLAAIKYMLKKSEYTEQTACPAG